ncbi:hypothetical protein FSP39_017801 [Pinctada imbricata]|uniref:G-protein coupled receptors family 1 profile domain-containing protein n=1 Tax=Pinctada imbricata TaxID=66713 RepID=A0AA89BTW6_PINIB|nr:hypothetical protein FSP39_017801 [Pinctada imbricata]
MMNASLSVNFTEVELRDDLNYHLLLRRLQTVIVTAVILFLGIVGNILVLVAYWNLLQRRKVKELKGRYFMPILAVADLASVFVGGIFFLYTDFNRATFESTAGCKCGMFFSFTTNTISILILLLIAISRYMKICLPHGKKMTEYWKRMSVVIVCIISTVSCIPFLYFSGSVTKSVNLGTLLPITYIDPDMAPYNVTFHMCFATRRNDVWWKLYYNALFLVQIINIGTMIFLYVKMGRVIQERCKAKISTSIRSFPKPSKTEKVSPSDKEVDSNDEVEIESTLRTEDSGVCHASTVFSTSTANNDSSTTGSFNTRHVIRRSKRGRKNKAWKSARNRFTMMFVVIVIIYAVTNVPTFIFLYMFMESKSFQRYFTLHAHFEEYNLILVLVRVHLINNIINPYIYGYFDFAFRREVKRICYSILLKPARYLWNRRSSVITRSTSN